MLEHPLWRHQNERCDRHDDRHGSVIKPHCGSSNPHNCVARPSAAALAAVSSMGAFTTPAPTAWLNPAHPWLWAGVLQPLTKAAIHQKPELTFDFQSFLNWSWLLAPTENWATGGADNNLIWKSEKTSSISHVKARAFGRTSARGWSARAPKSCASTDSVIKCAWCTQKRHALRPVVPEITAFPAWHPFIWLSALESLTMLCCAIPTGWRYRPSGHVHSVHRDIGQRDQYHPAAPASSDPT